jgi:hypothetical protein
MPGQIVAQSARQFELNAASASSAVADVRGVGPGIALRIEARFESGARQRLPHPLTQDSVEPAEIDKQRVVEVLLAMDRNDRLASASEREAARFVETVRRDMQVPVRSPEKL